MGKNNRETEYRNILESLQRIRSGIVQDYQQELMFTGMMPPAAQAELKVVADITGSVFCGFSSLGIPIVQDPDNESMVMVKVGDSAYRCLKSQIPDITVSKESFEEPPKTEAPVVDKPVSETISATDLSFAKEPVETEPEQTYEEETKEPESEVSAENTYEEVKEESLLEETVSETPVCEPEEEVTETGLTDTEETENTSELKDDFVDAPVNMEDAPSETPEEDNKSFGAKIIGGAPISVATGGIDKSEFFIDEQSKKVSEFIYTYSKIVVSHTDLGGGGKPEEMLVLIAPLKISKYQETSVPIVVTIVHNGKSVTASSYDILEEGKNIVTIDIDEFYFLCRGSFDNKGKFKATIVTTGISSQQGDKITPLFSRTYGDATNKETRNGHIKFHYTADSGPGSIEVFPFGTDTDRAGDFVAIVKNKEFVDYYMVSKSLKANNRAIIYTEGGVMNELVCHWDEDTLSAEMI